MEYFKLLYKLTLVLIKKNSIWHKKADKWSTLYGRNKRTEVNVKNSLWYLKPDKWSTPYGTQNW